MSGRKYIRLVEIWMLFILFLIVLWIFYNQFVMLLKSGRKTTFSF